MVTSMRGRGSSMGSRAFTLVELLMAMAIFTFGITAVFGLFLTGVRARAQADGLIRCSLAATSLVEDLRLDAIGTRPASAYVGDGFAANGAEAPLLMFPYTPAPGIWYVVESASDGATGAPVGMPSTVRLSLLIFYRPDLRAGTTFDDLLYRELRWTVPPAVAGDGQRLSAWFRDELVARGIAMRSEAVLIPRPSWQVQ